MRTGKMLKIRNLSKSFGGVRAVDNVSFDVPLGSIVALIGPNGAGKTSTFNLISGLAEPDTGTVTLFDKQLTGKSPDDVCRAGIARTFQISQLFETLSVRENIQTAALFGRRPRDDLQAAVVRANELVRAFDLVRHAEALPKDLTFAQRRNVEIARALVMDPQILLLDEVLAGLTASEIEDAIATIERVKSPTVGILLVEHQMRAVMRLADSVVVMMQGSVLMQGSPDEVRRHPKVLSAYLGEEIDASGSLVLQRSEDALPATSPMDGERQTFSAAVTPILAVRGLSAGYGPLTALHGIDLDVGENELVALIGSNGMGKSTALKAISGLLEPLTGTVHFEGRDITRLPPHSIARLGLGQVPEGRQLFQYMSVEDNLLLGAAFVAQAWCARRERLGEIFALFPRLAERRTQRAGRLSGGEQQMVAIGRALMARPRLLMLDEPTIGLAPIVVAETFEAIRRIKGTGVSVLLVEQNVGWALRVADRVYVMESGRIVLAETAEKLRSSREFLRSFGLE